MAPAYTPVSKSRVGSDAEREMHDAFDDDDDDNDDHGETVPLTLHSPRSPVSAGPPPPPGVTTSAAHIAYDFERDYDYPPPGSPPLSLSHTHSTFALPNNYGNSNGYLPTSPVLREPPQSIFRRMFGAVLPQAYQRVPGNDGRPLGRGSDNDGVFANVTAKPAPPVSIQTEDGEVHVVPEDTQQEAPPSYVTASADAVPSYWDTVVHAPSTMDLNGDMIIDELPTGSVVVFVLTTLISWFFQLPGFILTYLLHGTHAGRFGSQAGLALTLIQWGFGTTVMGAFPTPPDDPSSPDGSGMKPAEPLSGSSPSIIGFPVGGTPDDVMMGNSTSWFLLLTSMIGYFRVKRFELSVRASRTAPTVLVTEDIQRDMALRRNLEDVFGISVLFDSAVAAAAASPATPNGSEMLQQQRGILQAIDEARLQNDLRKRWA
ncbi:hypothetical protein F5148DRAFT_1167828, partial [Russula earlei]